MSEFASAAMVRVLQQGLRLLGNDPRSLAEPVPAGGAATVTLATKRALVTAAVAQHGLAGLPLLGRGLCDLAHEPTHRALVAATSPADLLARWQRLEGYIHSNHRIVVDSVSATRARVRHVAVAGLPPPQAAEDLVVLGVLAALLEAIGARAVAVSIQGVPAYPHGHEARLQRLVAQQATATWDLRWEPGARAEARPVARSGGAPASSAHQHPVDLLDPAPWPAWMHPVGRWLLGDLVRPLP